MEKSQADICGLKAWGGSEQKNENKKKRMTGNITRVDFSFKPIATIGATSVLEVARGKQHGHDIAWWHQPDPKSLKRCPPVPADCGTENMKTILVFFAATKGHVPHCFNFSLSSLPLFLFCGFVVETRTRKIMSTIRKLFGEHAEVFVLCKATLTLNCWISHKYRIWLLIPSFPSSPLQCDTLKNQNNVGNPWSVRPWWDDLDYCCITIIYIVP